MNRANATAIAQAAIENGMRTLLRTDGWNKVRAGVTTIEEKFCRSPKSRSTWTLASGEGRKQFISKPDPISWPAGIPATFPASRLAAKRLWQFDAPKEATLPWGVSSAYPTRNPCRQNLSPSPGVRSQPRLNIAWLPLEHVFLRVVELPASNADELHSMVGLQLEKLHRYP